MSVATLSMSQQDIDKVQCLGHFEEKKMFKRNPQLNKFNRAQNRSVDKKEGLLHLADRAIMAEGWCWAALTR